MLAVYKDNSEASSSLFFKIFSVKRNGENSVRCENQQKSNSAHWRLVKIKPAAIPGKEGLFRYLRNPGRDISFPILIRKEIDVGWLVVWV